MKKAVGQLGWAKRHVERPDGFDVVSARSCYAWERGSYENFNRLLRQYYPKRWAWPGMGPGRLRHVLDQRPTAGRPG